MSKINSFTSNNRGISPVIGVILLVALVVALVAFASFVFLSSGDETADNTPSASVEFTETSSGAQATVVRNENVDEFIVQAPTGSEFTLSDVGDSVSIPAGEGNYAVIAVQDDDEQVLSTLSVDEINFDGFFQVVEDEENEEAYAELQQEFEGIDDYELVLETEEDDDTEETSYYANNHNTSTLTNIDTTDNSYLIRNLPNNVDFTAPGTLNAAGISTNPNNGNFTVGDQIPLHELTNLCSGDQVLLTDEDGDVLAGDDVTIDLGCDQLRTVAQFDGNSNEITGVELVNLWQEDLDYYVFSYDGGIGAPAKEPLPDDGDVDVEVQALDADDETPISDAEITLGDETEPADEDGIATFENVEEDERVTAYANAENKNANWESFSVDPGTEINPPGLTSDSPETQEVYLYLDDETSEDPEEETGVVSADGGSTTVATSSGNGGGWSIGGGFGFGGGGGGGGGATVSSGSNIGGFYSDTTPATTTTLNSGPVDTSDPDFLDLEPPEREFNVFGIEDELIPDDESFQVQASLRTWNTEDTTTTLEVFHTEEGEEDGLHELGTIDDIELLGAESEGEPGDEITESIQLAFEDSDLGDDVRGEQIVYVSLAERDDYERAGILDVFAGEGTDAEINGDFVDNTNPDNVEVGENVSLTVDWDSIENVDASDIDTELTIDFFENGERVATEKLDGDSDAEVSYETPEFISTGYAQYSVGIQESQDVDLVESYTVNESFEEVDINTSVELINDGDCLELDGRDGQFECTVYTEDFDGEELEFEVDGNVEDNDGNDITEDASFTWEIGEEKTEETEETDTTVTHQFSEDTTHLIELQTVVEYDGETYSSQDTTIVNAIEPSVTIDGDSEEINFEEQIGIGDISITFE